MSEAEMILFFSATVLVIWVAFSFLWRWAEKRHQAEQRVRTDRVYIPPLSPVIKELIEKKPEEKP